MPRATLNPVFILTLCIMAGFAATAAPLEVYDLKCNYRTNPLGIDDAQPSLSWKLESTERGQFQTACEIFAATSPENLKHGIYDIWDSGKTNSHESIAIPYGGPALRSGQRVYWMVRVWNRAGKSSESRQTAWWEMGLLSPEEWRAVWISQPGAKDDSPAPLFRREFALKKGIKRARAYVSGLGYYELYLNGKRIGDHMLDPGWTTYSKRVLYSTYDVTAELKHGPNAAGLMLGNGWFNPLPLRMWGSLNLRDHLTVGVPRACLQIVIDYMDGSSDMVATDESWKTASGPILRNSVYLGEVYDARREQAGWDRPGFNDSAWPQAVRAAAPLGPLCAQDAPPIRVTRVLKPAGINEIKPGVYIVDFGQNFAGVVRLRVEGPPGAEIKIRSGELLHSNGALNGLTACVGQLKNNGQSDEYILKGRGIEVYSPHFTFHGFRYVEITGLPHRPLLDDVEGLRMNSDVTPAGAFECSNDELNRIQEMVLWTELSNLFSVESDCPHREKFGYGGDMVACSEAAIFNFDMERFYAKAVQDLADAARTNGGFTETAPAVGIADEGLGGGSGPIGWDTAQPFLQWELYQYYGDRSLLARQYEATRRWIEFLQRCAHANLIDNGISDHESLVPKPRFLTGSAFYHLNVTLFAKIARVLGYDADADAAEAMAGRIQGAFNRKFLNASTGVYDAGTQACQAFPLRLGLVPAEERPRVLDVLTRDILDTHQGHLSTGIFGTKFMLEALTDCGRADVAGKIVSQPTYPGWGYMLANGATTLWEHWAYSDNVYSHDHPMFGSVSEWFYKCLGGIKPAPDAAGFDKIIIQPQPVAGVQWVTCSYDSVHGKIVSNWTKDGHRFDLHVRIPIGTAATVMVPGRDATVVGSGEYDFTSTLP